MITDKQLNTISIVVGLLLTAYVAQDLHFNPRWYGDNGPGVGKLPRGIVSGYMGIAYGKGQVAEAAKLYYTPKTIDVTPKAVYRSDSPPLTSTVREVVAEGLNVVVHHCVDASGNQPANEVVDMFRTENGRIVWRKTIAQALDGQSCACSSLGKPVNLGLK
ncbi:nuclear transport factor 2 family protein [Glaciimonas sp. PCH181]|uniref:nuclear transport factor 2 family protein n=1 Tax=Glaciimonas sp. PCH181 TaxID=2133943 RepID=UPI000D36B827|nr:nuclear transport factor 2 family protein [Glaciimonas sp. PCH181]PUA20434.1 hypothetical protein C7W93_11990 [Glaciimonas sp. PCH181]